MVLGMGYSRGERYNLSDISQRNYIPSSYSQGISGYLRKCAIEKESECREGEVGEEN